MPSKLALSFRIFQNDQLIREDTLAQGVIKIGKVPSAHLRIDDDAVSRMHAIVEVTSGEVSLIDLGSTRGTFVNGRKINKAKLQSGDVITLGDTRVELAIAPIAGSPAPRPTVGLATTGPAPALPSTVGLATPSPAPAPGRTLERPAQVPQPTVESATSGSSRPMVELANAGPVTPVPLPPRPPALPAAALRPPPAPSPLSPSADRAVTPSMPAPSMPAPPAQPAMATGTAADPAVHPMMTPRPTADGADELGGARAIEVAAMLGDSVIGVKHCMDPRSGKVTPATWGVLAASIACLLASAIAFAASVSRAADNARSLAAWTGREHRPAHAFRPRALAAGIDWVAFGGLALGLVGVSLALVRMRGERTDPYYRIGTAPGVELPVEDAPSPAFPLVAPSGDDFVFNYGAGIDGELIIGGESTPLAELASTGRSRPSATVAGAIEVAIPPAARIRARVGQATFVVSSVARPRRHAMPLFASLENRALSYAAASLAAHLALWGFVQLIPPDASGVNVIPGATEDSRMRIVSTAHTEPPPEKLEDSGSGGGDEVDATAMALPSGAAGTPEAAQRDGRMQVARTHERPQLTRDAAIEAARRDGILGSDGLLSGVTVLAATGDYSSGFDLTNVNGPIYGAGGEGAGNFGGGVQGLGAGGDGDGTGGLCGTIGACGRYDTIGTGLHAGDNFGLRPGPGGRGGPGRTPILPRIGEAVTSGPTYDKSIVRRYIRRHINEIGYCYDKQLLAHPGIQGAITVTFLISPQGNVQSASASGFDAEVSSCLTGVIEAIEFPPPREGSVQVSYPFHFRAAGQ